MYRQIHPKKWENQNMFTLRVCPILLRLFMFIYLEFYLTKYAHELTKIVKKKYNIFERNCGGFVCILTCGGSYALDILSRFVTIPWIGYVIFWFEEFWTHISLGKVFNLDRGKLLILYLILLKLFGCIKKTNYGFVQSLCFIEVLGIVQICKVEKWRMMNERNWCTGLVVKWLLCGPKMVNYKSGGPKRMQWLVG